MDSRDLEPWQCERMFNAIRSRLAYLGRLQARMEQVGFPSHDPLYRLTVGAHNALHALFVDLHYRSCKSGVGLPRGSRDDRT